MAKAPPKPLAYIKTVRARGKVYEYFRTGKTVDGKEVLQPLPARSDTRNFGQVYAAMVGARMARENVPLAPSVRELSKAYQRDDKFTKLADSTQNTYVIYLRRIEDELGIAPVDQVERQDIEALMDKMSDTPGAANMTLLILRNLFKLAIRKKWVRQDPCEGVEELAKSGKTHEPWPMPLLQEGLADPVFGLPIALLFYTAQRIGDVCSMRWDHVRDGYMSVIQEKTGIELDIRVHADLARILAKTPKTAMTILQDPKGAPLKRETLREQLKAWALERGYQIVPHGLRKNAVNMLLEVGCTVAETTAISGQSLKIVEHYAKRRDRKKLGSAAILRWERTNEEHGKREKTQ